MRQRYVEQIADRILSLVYRATGSGMNLAGIREEIAIAYDAGAKAAPVARAVTVKLKPVVWTPAGTENDWLSNASIDGREFGFVSTDTRGGAVSAQVLTLSGDEDEMYRRVLYEHMLFAPAAEAKAREWVEATFLHSLASFLTVGEE